MTCLGLSEWTDCCAKKSRFDKLLDDEQAEKLSAGYTPKSTVKANKWAIDNFQAWRTWRNELRPQETVQSETKLLTSGDMQLHNKWLSRHAVETRGEKGRIYPPGTVHSLLSGLQRHMLSLNPSAARFLDKNTQFKELHGTLDSIFRHLHESGAGHQVRQAEVITREVENMLWESGQLGTSTPKALSNAVFYYNGKSFCLRGGMENRKLGYIYQENVSKNQAGTYKQLHLQNKAVPIYACPEAGIRCHVYLLDLYISKLPQDAIQKELFYVRTSTTGSPCQSNSTLVFCRTNR